MPYFNGQACSKVRTARTAGGKDEAAFRELLANTAKHSKKGLMPFAMVGVLLIMAMVIVAVFSVSQAQGSSTEDPSTLGLSDTRSVDTQIFSSQRAAGNQQAASQADGISVSETSNAAASAQRSITVKDPDPVVVPIAIDPANPLAQQKAAEVCTLDPLPTAPHVAPDTNDGTWSSGIASAYCIATNDDGNGNFGVTNTASGVDLTDNSITVAVPESQSYRVGSICEVCYDGKVVIATVTDTGGFARYGRALDLAPGVWKAFGFSSYGDWGTRTVSYRFL